MFSIASAIAAIVGFLRDLLGWKRREEDRQAGRDEAILEGNLQADEAISAANQAREAVNSELVRDPSKLRAEDEFSRPD
jgi:ABC-type uncharacterized transport system YnjBCD ATPase subunit